MRARQAPRPGGVDPERVAASPQVPARPDFGAHPPSGIVSRIAAPPLSRLLILGAALLFSTGGAAIKATSLSGWQVAGFRSGVAALTLLLLVPAWRRWWQPRALAVGVPYGVTMILYVVSNKLTTAANTIFLQASAPLYLLLLGPWLLGERTRASDVLFTVTLLAGVVMFFAGVEPPLATAPDPLRGNWLALLSGLTWALTIMGLRWLARADAAQGSELGGAAVVAGNVLALLACLPWALPVAESLATDWLVVAYLGTFQIGLAYVLLTRGVRRVPALEASLLLLLEPVLNAVWAWLVHGEQPGPWSLGGSTLILGATVLLTLRRSP